MDLPSVAPSSRTPRTERECGYLDCPNRGAPLETEYLDVIRGAGFAEVAVTWRAPVFDGAPVERKARKYGSEGVNIRGRKPGGPAA